MSGNIDIVNDILKPGINLGFNYLNSTVGRGANQESLRTNQGVNAGNVGGILPINLNWGTIAIIGVAIVGIAFIIKKV